MKRVLSAILAFFLTISMTVMAVYAEEDEAEAPVFVPRKYETDYGEIPSVWDEVWHMEGYQWDEYIKLDGEKDPVYNYGLILNADQLIDGEETGASAKVYLLYDMCLRVFAEVTDSELVEPVYGLEVILNDVYDNGKKTSSYSTNAFLSKDNVLNYKQWNGVTFAEQSLLDTNMEVLALYDPAFQTGDVSVNDTETSSDTETVMSDADKGSKASNKAADESGETGGGLSGGALAAFVVSGGLLGIVIMVLIVRRERKNEK